MKRVPLHSGHRLDLIARGISFDDPLTFDLEEIAGDVFHQLLDDTCVSVCTQPVVVEVKPYLAYFFFF